MDRDECVVIENVTYTGELHTGQSFFIRHEDTKYNIPNFAVHPDSDIHYRCGDERVGRLILLEKIAVERGLVDPPSRSMGGGIPLKRHRLPDEPELMPEAELDAMNKLAGGVRWKHLDSIGPEVYLDDELLAIFEGAGQEETRAFQFFLTGGSFMHKVIEENRRLREWVAKALKTQQRRQKPKR
jgi:hypothetical protein